MRDLEGEREREGENACVCMGITVVSTKASRKAPYKRADYNLPAAEGGKWPGRVRMMMPRAHLTPCLRWRECLSWLCQFDHFNRLVYMEGLSSQSLKRRKAS